MKIYLIALISIISIFSINTYAGDNENYITDFCREHNFKLQELYNEDTEIKDIYISGDGIKDHGYNDYSIIFKLTLPKDKVVLENDGIFSGEIFLYNYMGLKDSYKNDCSLHGSVLDNMIGDYGEVSVDGYAIMYDDSAKGEGYCDIYYETEFNKKDNENFLYLGNNIININGMDHKLSNPILYENNKAYVSASEIDRIFLLNKYNYYNNLVAKKIGVVNYYLIDDVINALWADSVILYDYDNKIVTGVNFGYNNQSESRENTLSYSELLNILNKILILKS